MSVLTSRCCSKTNGSRRRRRRRRQQCEAASKTVVGSAGGGMITVTANGAMEIVAVKIDPKPRSRTTPTCYKTWLRPLANDALRKARDMMAEEMKSVTKA